MNAYKTNISFKTLVPGAGQSGHFQPSQLQRIELNWTCDGTPGASGCNDILDSVIFADDTIQNKGGVAPGDSGGNIR